MSVQGHFRVPYPLDYQCHISSISQHEHENCALGQAAVVLNRGQELGSCDYEMDAPVGLGRGSEPHW